MVYFVDIDETICEYGDDRSYPLAKPIVKNMYMLDRLDKIKLFSDNRKTIDMLIVLDLLRIIPYTKDKKIVEYLKKCLDRSIRDD